MSLMMNSASSTDKGSRPPRKSARDQRLRNAIARKKLERLRERQLLRKHLEDPWH